MIKIIPLIKVNSVNMSFGKKVIFAGINDMPDSFIRSCDGDVKTPYGQLTYTADGKFKELKFNRPVSLSEALNCIKSAQNEYNLVKQSMLTSSYIYNQIDRALSEKFKDDKFVSLVGAGHSAIALKREKGNILKIARFNQFEFRYGPESFDAKIFEKGNANGYYYYIQEECCQDNLRQEHVEEMKKLIQESGYDVFDLSIQQIGLNKDGKLCLIDSECARDNSLVKAKEEALSKWMLEHGIEDYL